LALIALFAFYSWLDLLFCRRLRSVDSLFASVYRPHTYNDGYRLATGPASEYSRPLRSDQPTYKHPRHLTLKQGGNVIKTLPLFTFACTVFFTAGQPSQAQKVDQPLAKQVSVNGTTIRYWEQGKGVPVVFVHGAISDHRYWEPQREVVAKSYRFIGLDRRYFGTAPWPDSGSRHSQATHVADLAAFIRELKIGPAFLVGTSAGAQVSLVMAVKHPELVRGLFVNEPPLDSIVTDPGDRKVVSEFRTDPRRAAAQAAARAGNMTEAAKLSADFVHGQTGVFDALPPARKAMHTDNARTLALDAPPSEPVTCAQLGQLKIAVTITKGQSTKAPSKIIAEAAHRCIPGSQLITIPAAMHGASWQNSPAFNAALLAFLARN
jgi:pimeloyl-ACP methyl ester carboxylesterase